MKDTAMHRQNRHATLFDELDRAARQPEWLRQLRREALGRFLALGFPTTQDEEWRNTNVAPIARTDFTLASLPERAVSAQDIEPHALPELKGCQLVFVNGHLAPGLSEVGALPDGVLIASIPEALETDPECVRHFLGRAASTEENAFTALNTAFVNDGAFLYVPGGLTLEEPLHLLYLTVPGAGPAVTHPRNLIVLQRAAKATIVETYAGIGDGRYLTNAVTELLLEDGAIAEHVKLQHESVSAWHVGSLHVHQARDSHLMSCGFSFGGELVRNDTGAVLDGPGATAEMDGLYLARGRQHVDNHTTLDHAQPHCTSSESFKGVLAGSSSAVFNGKVIVRKDAQKTDSRQSNRNLLLSEDALVNTKPELEIYADDVRCTHGATIGQLDEDSVFYLRTRGIDLESARSLLVHAFASEIVGRVRALPIRQRLEPAILAWLGQSQGGAA
jgi:Fe-S cluster assembly protein SufD